jgi:uncharacterized protein YbaP (TraB family)
MLPIHKGGAQPGGVQVPERLVFSGLNAHRGSIRSLIRRLAAAAVLPALALAALPTAPAAAISVTSAPLAVQTGPALWVVQDADTTIFLFGTFHALDGRSQWFTRSVRAAFDASDSLILETLVPEDPAELHAVLARNSLASEPKVGEPVVSFNQAPSFVASAGQAMAAGHSMGMSVDHGADAVLRRAADASGKPVEGLESFEFQLQMFGSLSAGPAPAPGPSRHGKNNLGRLMGGMQSAWNRGDNDGFAALLGNVRAQSPQAYKTLFIDRNANWAGWIADRMAQPGTVFVAVGTGHLVGPDSVQSQLAARGISSARIS